MNENQPTSKDFNIEEANGVRTTTIEIVKISTDLEMIKDNSGTIYDLETLHFIVPKGGKIVDAVKDAMGYLKTQKDKTKAELKYKGIEVSFTRDDKIKEILDRICAINDFIENDFSANLNFSPLQQ